MPVLEARGIVRRYGEFTAINALDLSVEAGECLAILGPNGAGKTTAVEIFEGYRSRDAGELSVLGIDPAHPTRDWRKKIGIVSQNSNDLRDATVSEAVRHFSHFYDHPRDVNETVFLVGLSNKSSSVVRTLSGGERRRLDVALGVVGRPELLFLDEPTTGFDPEARRSFWKLIEDLKSQGVTIILTTHYLEEADALADRVAVIARGIKIADTTPGQLGERASGMVTVKWREGHEMREISTTSPSAFVVELSARLDGEIPELEIVRTSLEQAYLDMLEDSA